MSIGEDPCKMMSSVRRTAKVPHFESKPSHVRKMTKATIF